MCIATPHQKLFAEKDKKIFSSKIFKVIYAVSEDLHISAIASMLSSRKVKSSVKRHLCYRLWKCKLADHNSLRLLILATNYTQYATKKDISISIDYFFHYIATRA